MTRVQIRARLIAELDAQRRGRLTAQELVDLARPADHPLHADFEWDDAKAGEAYRRKQASILIKMVRFEVRIVDMPPAVAPVYVREPGAPKGSFIRTDVVANDPEMSRDTLMADLDRVPMAMQRAKVLAEIFDLMPVYEHYATGFEQLARALRKAVVQRSKVAPKAAKRLPTQKRRAA
jgi:hypothetical protein